MRKPTCFSLGNLLQDYVGWVTAEQVVTALKEVDSGLKGCWVLSHQIKSFVVISVCAYSLSSSTRKKTNKTKHRLSWNDLHIWIVPLYHTGLDAAPWMHVIMGCTTDIRLRKWERVKTVGQTEVRGFTLPLSSVRNMWTSQGRQEQADGWHHSLFKMRQ